MKYTLEGMKQMTPLEEIRHSAAHILAAAVLKLYPTAKLDIGPPTASGFYYDFDLDHKLTADDLVAIEAQMKKLIKERQLFICKTVSRQEAEAYLTSIHQPYKLERLQDIDAAEPITIYQNGDFQDLCAGTHVHRSDHIKAFKLLSIAGAYFKGNEQNKQLQRIYGTAFASQAELDTYLENLEQARKRDHRKLGKELQLFHIDETVGAGLILWTPKGTIIRQQLQAFISEELHKYNYEQVVTPHIGRLELYQTSGHFPYYQESQYPPIIEHKEWDRLSKTECSCAEISNLLNKGSIEGYLLKPMNCPMHIKIYESQPRSYRELPLRLAEFGTVYRWEQSGELNGLMRVRGLTQDDAHIFCMEDQIGAEIEGCLAIVQTVLNTLKLGTYRIRLGFRDPDASKYTGNPVYWDKAEAALKQAVQVLEVPFTEEPGEAAFYGPKIDFVVKDVIGREWQLGTIQLDYNLPERFNLTYTGSDNKLHRPVMIHRAPFGSLERFCGVLIEHFAGNFPTWLAPEQVRLLSISDDQLPYAQMIQQQLKALKIRASVDMKSDKLGAKIRTAELEKIPYTLVIGKSEVENHTVTVRSRINKSAEGTISVQAFIDWIQQEIQSRS